MKGFNIFVQSAVNVRRERHKNPNSSVVAETMNILANSSYGCQIMNRRRHTVAKYLSDETTLRAITNKMFRHLGYINDQLYEVKLVKSEFEHKEPITVGVYILQGEKLRILEPY